MKRIRAIAFVLRAARGEAREPSRRTGASQDVASWLYQQDCNSTASASIYASRPSFLTFGCDGARAAAPIANARTAFILVAQLANLRPLAPGWLVEQPVLLGCDFARLTTRYAREPVEQPLGGLQQPSCRDFTGFRHPAYLGLCGLLRNLPASPARIQAALSLLLLTSSAAQILHS